MLLAHVFHVNKSTDVLSKHFSDNDLSFLAPSFKQKYYLRTTGNAYLSG